MGLKEIVVEITLYTRYYVSMCIHVHAELVEIVVSCPILHKNRIIIISDVILVYSFSVYIADERKLNGLCLIGSNIKELTIHRRGGTYPLGNGDATLTVFEDTVKMETVVRYAVILHGPFVYSAGFKPASVVVYLNLEGANLLKPLKLMLKHWCKPFEGTSKAALKLLRAPHTTSEMKNFRYIFHEVQGDSLHNTATFTISEPQCLYCVEMEKESQASYNAISFQKNLPEGDLVKFRIQLMCDCLEWNAVSTCTVLKVK